MAERYAVVLAGGRGERLWPLSRKKKPKQLLPFINEESLLQQILTRITPLVSLEQRWIITTEALLTEIKKTAGSLVGHIVTEPSSRNTAPAMILAARKIAAKDPDAVLVFLSADLYIPDDRFLESLTYAIDYAEKNQKITLLGLRPTYASTQFGYISFQNQPSYPAPVSGFFEKPNKATAADYIKKGYLWNSGIFVAPVKVFLAECLKYAPRLLKNVDSFLQGKADYKTIESISIDYAVMEKSESLAVLPADFVWSDVGTLETFLRLRQQTNRSRPTVIQIDSEDNLVESELPLVALVGVKNLSVIQTKDVLLIVDRGQTEKVKQVVQQVNQKHQEYL